MRSAIWLTAVLLAVGCGPGNYDLVPVSGTVTLDGKPVAGVESGLKAGLEVVAGAAIVGERDVKPVPGDGQGMAACRQRGQP